MLEKPERLPSRRFGAESPGAWLPAGTKGLSPGFIPRLYPLGVGRVTDRDFLLSESAYSLCKTALARQALQAQARWMSRLCVDRLSWLIEKEILCILWEKCQGGCVDINTIFKIQTCIGEECFGRPFQFSCCSPKPVMGKTLSWQLLEEFPWHSRPMYF